MIDTNNIEEMQKLAENHLQELIRCAHLSTTSEIKIHPDGVEITVDHMVTTPLMRAAVSLHECYPDGGVYVVIHGGRLLLHVYYKFEDY